ncbi:MAG TPA: mucin desulfatase [Lentisphaeria bacterium]|nr:MAG: hypothetical protein A2X47_00260 [Lentisphaerae bacterium GWF2_38_69]HBM14872.1 mucin desulfatase [Lentisphaeria bacterium]
MYDLKQIISNFQIHGNYLSGIPYGNGHINSTYKVTLNQAGINVSYTLQKINTAIFKDPLKVIENIVRVTDCQKEFYSNSDDSSRKHMTLVKNKDGTYLHEEKDGSVWRVYLFIEKALTYEIIENEEYAYKTARAFGEFQKSLANIKGERLHEIIPDFHNTPKRFMALDKAIDKDIAKRASGVKDEIGFAFSRRDKAAKLIDLHKSGLIPERITHNDTKLNNLMIDEKSKQPICVIDLDTLMPGFSAYDFGELMRTGVSPTMEDEKDISKIHIRINVFEAIVKGFLDATSGFINKAEKENILWGGYLMTLENAVRFLTDHLNNDIYYRIHRENHNLDRCRTQFALLKCIESEWDNLVGIIKKY